LAPFPVREGCQGFAEPNLSTLLYKSKNQPAIARKGFELWNKNILFFNGRAKDIRIGYGTFILPLQSP
jgi:hypothetical protein